MYWEKLTDVNNGAVSSILSRHRFEEILRFLHLADYNNLAKEDKFAKIRPLASLLNEKWLAHFPKENFLFVDESMVPYYGRNGLKQHIHGKPILFGYKVWCLCTRTGYLAQAIPYQGRSIDYSNPEFGMGGSVVLDLISELSSHVEYRLFFDNLFTSIPLIDHLKQANIGATGTIRVNRTGKTPLTDYRKMTKVARGKYWHVKDKGSGCIPANIAMQGFYRSNAGSHTGLLSAACTGPVSFWPQGLQWARAGCLYGLRSGSCGLTVYVYELRSVWCSLTVYRFT